MVASTLRSSRTRLSPVLPAAFSTPPPEPARSAQQVYVASTQYPVSDLLLRSIGTFCSSPEGCYETCDECPNGTTAFRVGSDGCYMNHFPGWSHAGCFNAGGNEWNTSSFFVNGIDECYSIARGGQFKFFAMQGSLCQPLNGFSMSPGVSSGCSYECEVSASGSKYDTLCGGPSAISLYATLRATYLGVYDSHSLNVADLLENIPSGFPSLQHCYQKSLRFGYKYFFLVGGTDCLATNSDQGALLTENTSPNLNLILKCLNGDPCGGPTTATLYSVDNAPSEYLSSQGSR